MRKERLYGGLDCFRIPAALMVIAIHTSIVINFNKTADFFLTSILARVAVPFFLMVTGQFVISGLFEKKRDNRKIAAYIRKLMLLYVCAIVLYLPIGIYAGHYQNISVTGGLKMLLFDGTFYHLWYFPACILAVVLIWAAQKWLSFNTLLLISALLYIIGLFGDSYYGLAEKMPVFVSVYEKIFCISSYTRNGFFFAPVFLLLGVKVPKQADVIEGDGKKNRKSAGIGLLLSFAAMTAEGFLLHAFDLQRHDSMYLFLPLVMVYLYKCLLSYQCAPKRQNRFIATWMYIVHPGVIVVIRLLAKALHLTGWCVENCLVHYILVAGLSYLSGYFMWLIYTYFRGCHNHCGRAWIEIDKKALAHNVEFMKSRLPKHCRLMPAIKANAYGHGDVLIARELCKLGVDAFCVAGVREAVALRRAGITGEILVLGYTHPEQFPLLKQHHLIQTVVDYAYAELLNAYGRKLHVHIGVDTGMHRLGERSENIEELCAIFDMENLIIDGMFTHLSADDTMGEKEQDFTNTQVKVFYQVVKDIKARGYHCPKLHLQSSYGVLNYPEISADYARVGIALYGVLSTSEDMENWRSELQPVLSLKTRVVTVRTLYAGESAGYSMQYTADEDMRIATLSMGYADGLPRALSQQSGYVLIHGRRASIIGLICMDQVIVNVTDIPDVAEGDIAVVIGSEGEEEILASDLADACGTITNEILSRLGQRLERVVV